MTKQHAEEPRSAEIIALHGKKMKKRRHSETTQVTANLHIDTGLAGSDQFSSTVEPPPRQKKKKDKKEQSTCVHGQASVISPTVEPSPDIVVAPVVTAELSKAEQKALRKERKRQKKLVKAQARQEPENPPLAGSENQPVASTSTVSVHLQPQKPPSPDAISAFIRENNVAYEPPIALAEFPPVLDFASVPLHGDLAVSLSNFRKPTPVQSAAWPVLLGGRDVVGIAQTGSGKTIAFGVPALQHILSLPPKEKGIIGLVIAPTRELAIQTHENLDALGSKLKPPVRSVCIYGGMSKQAQVQSLADRAVRIVVGTPGRLLDLSREGSLKLEKVTWVVLDEADRLLDKGFEPDIRAIVTQCAPAPTTASPFTFGKPSKARLTAMFSATWPTGVRALASDFTHNPIRTLIGADELQASTSISQKVIVLQDGMEKDRKLLDILRETPGLSKKGQGTDRTKAILFALYKKEAARIYQTLLRKGFEVACIEGDMSQQNRQDSLEKFKTGQCALLVATDVAARGLDIPKVDTVINITFPLTIEDYIHRIGRTGRAGRSGSSITFFTEMDKAKAGELMRVLRDAGQPVPEALGQWGTTIKKKSHSSYGDHFKEVDTTVKGKKITFS